MRGLIITLVWLLSAICAVGSPYFLPVPASFPASSAFGSVQAESWFAGAVIPCGAGTDVTAIADGKVVRTSAKCWESGTVDQNYGLCIESEFPGYCKTVIVYGRLVRPQSLKIPVCKMSDVELITYRYGETINAGEKIGQIGSFGQSPGLCLLIYSELQDHCSLPFLDLSFRPLPRPASARSRGGTIGYGNFWDPIGFLKEMKII